MIIHHQDNKTEIASPAKVNLHLELLGKRPDGFHELETVMSSISLYDHLSFTPTRDFRIRMRLVVGAGKLDSQPQDDFPVDDRNLIYRSLDLMRQTARVELGDSACESGLDIVVLKRIPSAAGLGGASSNAAAALLAGNLIWKLGWSKTRLESLALQIGSDVPFFLTCGSAICRGRGERIESLSVSSGLAMVVVKPAKSLSTSDVFSQVSNFSDTRVGLDRISRRLKSGDRHEIGRHMFNRLQRFAEPMTDQIRNLSGEFERLGCLGHQMSGSGSSYFGLFSNQRVARRASRLLSSRLPHSKIFCVGTSAPFKFGSQF